MLLPRASAPSCCLLAVHSAMPQNSHSIAASKPAGHMPAHYSSTGLTADRHSCITLLHPTVLTPDHTHTSLDAGCWNQLHITLRSCSVHLRNAVCTSVELSQRCCLQMSTRGRGWMLHECKLLVLKPAVKNKTLLPIFYLFFCLSRHLHPACSTKGCHAHKLQPLCTHNLSGPSALLSPPAPPPLPPPPFL